MNMRILSVPTDCPVVLPDAVEHPVALRRRKAGTLVQSPVGPTATCCFVVRSVVLFSPHHGHAALRQIHGAGTGMAAACAARMGKFTYAKLFLSTSRGVVAPLPSSPSNKVPTVRNTSSASRRLVLEATPVLS